jgi:circadian clock protein KaiC
VGPASSTVAGLDLLETGVPRLDDILGGGLPRGGLALVVGAPGTGKTTLAQQTAFHHAARDGTVMFLTGFSETNEKLLTLGRTLSFFDPSVVGTKIQLGSVPDLLRDGPEQAERAVVTTARQLGARLVILDGFRGIGPLLGSEATQAAARFLYHIGAQLALLGTTTLVLVEGNPGDTSSPAELAVSDVLIGLHSETAWGRQRRLLQVLKRRGAAPLAGYHPYAIDTGGLHIWPRFESVVPPVEAAWLPGRAGFRRPRIDELMHGGLTEGTATLAAGSFGTGKTLLGVHFAAEGGERGEPILLLSFMESAAQLREKGRIFGLPLEEYEARGVLRIATMPAHDLEADCVATLLRDDVERRDVKRLVIDSAAQLERAIVDEARRPGFFAALVGYLRGRGVTTYMTYEIAGMGGQFDLAETPLAPLAENVLRLRTVVEDGGMQRLFSIMHMRFSDHDHRPHEYTIEAGQGIVMRGVASSQSSGEASSDNGGRDARGAGPSHGRGA